MTTTTFFEHFLKELDDNSQLYPYYKLNCGSYAKKEFRKAYFLQRLEYIGKNVEKTANIIVLDCGCGYGTTAFFLGLNGVKVIGTTLEFYFEQIDKRKQYWSNFGSIGNVHFVYQDIFESTFEENSFDYIILQDTLHHIEPIKDALKILFKLLKKGGKIILVEENGGCLPRQAILYAQRKNNRIIEYYDQILQKTILFGNENIRTEKKWIELFKKEGFEYLEKKTQYIRFYLPFWYKKQNTEEIIEKEQKIAFRSAFLRRRFFFGLNMIFTKN
jgi:SAM-dependent methyltransferase